MSRRHKERAWSSSERGIDGAEAGSSDAAAQGEGRERRDRGRGAADPWSDEAMVASRTRPSEFNEWT